MPVGRPTKEFHEYLIQSETSKPTHDEYLISPATAYLAYTVEAKSAVHHCSRHFQKKLDGSYTKDSVDSLQQITVGLLPAIMGHFETFQKYLFAGMFDYSIYLKGFNIEKFLEALKKVDPFGIDITRLSAYRGVGAHSVGLLLADSLSGWHNPQKVNAYYKCFEFGKEFYSKEAVKSLEVLWQFRHSIVHTGGTLTIADAQKLQTISKLGGRKIAFEDQFIFEVARRMHKVIKSGVETFGTNYKARLNDDIPQDKKGEIDKLFLVKSSVSAWLR